MKALNLNDETKTQLSKIADSYIRSFIYPRIPEPKYKESLILKFLECFEKGTKDSAAYTTYEVGAKCMGWLLDRRDLLNEYWVDTEYYGVVKVWGKNKTSVRKRLNRRLWGRILSIVLVEEFNPNKFLEDNLK